MKKNIYLLVLSCCFTLFAACGSKKENSYLNEMVTDSKTILRGNCLERENIPSEEDVFYNIASVIDFIKDDYIFEMCEKEDKGLIYKVNALNLSDPSFEVYYIGNYLGITCDRSFLKNEMEKNIILGQAVVVGCLDIGKCDINEADETSIKEVEDYLKEIFPGLVLEEYSRQIVYGDAGQNTFVYSIQDGTTPRKVFSWTSYMKDPNITISVYNREVLDEFLLQ